MNGSIISRGKDTWRLAWDLPRGPDGKRRQSYKTIRGKKSDAMKELRRIVAELDNGIVIEPSKETVAQYLRRWLTAKVTLRETTRQGYSQIIEKHLAPYFDRVPVQKLNASHIKGYYGSKRVQSDDRPALSEQSLLHHHRLLGKAMSDAVCDDLIPRNPMDKLTSADKPKPKQRTVDVLSLEETQQFLALFEGDRQLHCMLTLAVTTGLRRGEVLGLKWDCVNLGAAAIQVRRSLTKGGFEELVKTKSSRRRVTLPKITTKALAAHKARQAASKLSLGALYDDQGFVFAREDGTPVGPHVFTGAVQRRVKGTDLKGAGIHTLRHTHASHLLLQDQHPKVVSERLGHSTIGITLNTYSHLLAGMEEAAADAVDKLFPAGF